MRYEDDIAELVRRDPVAMFRLLRHGNVSPPRSAICSMWIARMKPADRHAR
jgi:hypothetical protein